jgi:hypothetical protein
MFYRYALFFCLLFRVIFDVNTVSAQVADTVVLFDDVKIRVLVSGDTVGMSVRQFSNVVELIGSMDKGLDLCHQQLNKMYTALSVSDTIALKMSSLASVYQSQVLLYQSQYRSMAEIADRQSKMLTDMNTSRVRENNRYLWRGIGYGIGGGAVLGIIVGAIILR